MARTPEQMERLFDEVEIRSLQARYGDAVSRQAWATFPDLYAPDATIELDLRDSGTRSFSGGAAIAAFIESSMVAFEYFEFALLNAVVDTIDGDTATGRVYIMELRQNAETHAWSNAYGLYLDDYRRIDSRWVFAHRRYSSLARFFPDGETTIFDIPSE